MKPRLELAALFAVFLTPVVIAWLFASGVLDWRSRGLVNHGTLLEPPVPIVSGVEDAAASALNGPPGTWSMLYLTHRDCDTPCRSQLENLAKIHQLTGRDQQRVRVLSAGPPRSAPAMPGARALQLTENQLAGFRATVAERTGLQTPFVALVDWNGSAVLVYPSEQIPNGLWEDLSLLLRATDTQ